MYVVEMEIGNDFENVWTEVDALAAPKCQRTENAKGADFPEQTFSGDGWETLKERIARFMHAEVRADFSWKVLSEIDALNRTEEYKGADALHDTADGNEYMLAAFEKATGSASLDPACEHTTGLINDAWNMVIAYGYARPWGYPVTVLQASNDRYSTPFWTVSLSDADTQFDDVLFFDKELATRFAELHGVEFIDDSEE